MLNDKKIIQNVMKSSQGDEKAWESVCNVYRDNLYEKAFSETHDEIISQKIAASAFSYAYSHFTELKNLKEFDDWLYEILKKELSSWENVSLDMEEITEKSASDSSALQLSLKARQDLANEIMHDLTDMEQTVLLLYTYEHKTISQIAENIRISEKEAEKLLESAEEKVKKYISDNGIDRQYHIDALSLFCSLINSLHPEKEYDHKIEKTPAHGEKQDEIPEIIIQRKKTSGFRSVLSKKKIAGFLICIAVACAGIFGGTRLYDYSQNRSGSGKSQTGNGKKKVSDVYTNAVQNEVKDEYGPSVHSDLTSGYWYQKNEQGYDVLTAGDFKGKHGVINTVVADIDHDSQNEMIVFYRENPGSADTQSANHPSINQWDFGFSVWERNGNQMIKQAEKSVFTFNYGQQSSDAAPNYEYPEYFGADVSLKKMDFGYEILVYIYSDYFGANYGQTRSPDCVYGYRYNQNQISDLGSFDFSPVGLEESDTLKELGFTPDDFSGDMTYEEYIQKNGEKEEIYDVYSINRSTDIDDRLEYNTNHSDEDVSNFEILLKTKTYKLNQLKIKETKQKEKVSTSYNQIKVPESEYDSTFSTGSFHSLAILQDGTVLAWGQNGSGQLGIGTTDNVNEPVPVKNLKNVKYVACGDKSSAAITEDGDLYTWGNNAYGQLGIGSTDNCDVPQKVEGLSHVKMVSMGLDASAAITEDGNFYSWGNIGESLEGEKDKNILTPQSISNAKNAKYVSMGLNGTYGFIDQNGDLYTWGANNYGEAGVGNLHMKIEYPVKVDGISGVKQVCLGDENGAAITENGDLYTWGWSMFGMLGAQEQSSYRTTPGKVSGISSAKHVSMEGARVSVVTEDNSLYEWGLEKADVFEEAEYSAEPQKSDLNHVVDVKSGDSHTLYCTEDGRLYAQGSNLYGQIGIGSDGTDAKKITPVKFSVRKLKDLSTQNKKELDEKAENYLSKQKKNQKYQKVGSMVQTLSNIKDLDPQKPYNRYVVFFQKAGSEQIVAVSMEDVALYSDDRIDYWKPSLLSDQWDSKKEIPSEWKGWNTDMKLLKN